MTLRVELGHRSGRSGSSLPPFATVEWAGRVGHPSSYALLGGTRSDQSRVSQFGSGGLFKESLAAPADDVCWGLPPEYEDAILEVLAEQPQPVLVGRAAHGAVGSSAKVFRTVALMLSHVLAADLPGNDAAVWQEWDRGWNAA